MYILHNARFYKLEICRESQLIHGTRNSRMLKTPNLGSEYSPEAIPALIINCGKKIQTMKVAMYSTLEIGCVVCGLETSVSVLRLCQYFNRLG